MVWRTAPAPNIPPNPQSGDVMRRRWTITTHATGRPRDVDVILYDKLSHMRAAAARHSNAWDSKRSDFADTLAICHGFQRIHYNEDGTEDERPLAVILRFARERLNPEIVSHEVAHAAQHLYGLDCLTEDDKAEDHFNSGNETFAYLLGDLFTIVWTLTNEQRQ